MQTPETDSQKGLGATAKEVAEHASGLVRLELELAQLELKRKATSLGIGIGLAVGAAVVVFYAVGFAFATIAAGLATFLSVWLSLLIVTLGLLTVAAILGLIGRSKIQKGTPPLPEQAIEEAKRTTEALKQSPPAKPAETSNVGVASERLGSNGR